jgi:hypothetical protein
MMLGAPRIVPDAVLAPVFVTANQHSQQDHRAQQRRLHVRVYGHFTARCGESGHISEEQKALSDVVS